jgi:MscS family membrane protein
LLTETPTHDISSFLEGWLQPTLIFIGTLVVLIFSRWLLARLGRKARLTLLGRLAPQASNLVLLFGLQMMIETAPIPAKAEAWSRAGIYVLGVFLVLGLVRRAALLGLEWGAVRAPSGSITLQEGFVPLIRNLITLFVVLAGGIMILKHFGYDVLSLLTALGVGSLAVGLAAQPTLSNMISGFTLIIDRNLKPGDRITLAGQTGEVEEIGLRSTRIRTGNGKTLIVPNSELVNTRILNLSIPSRAVAATLQLRLAHGTPFPRIQEICREILSGLPRVLQTKGFGANLSALNELGLTVTVFFWVDDQDQEGITISEFHQKLIERMEREGLRLAQLPSVAPLPTNS